MTSDLVQRMVSEKPCREKLMIRGDTLLLERGQGNVARVKNGRSPIIPEWKHAAPRARWRTLRADWPGKLTKHLLLAKWNINSP